MVFFFIGMYVCIYYVSGQDKPREIMLNVPAEHMEMTDVVLFVAKPLFSEDL